MVAGDPISEPFRPDFDPVSAPFRNLSIAPGIRDDHSELAKLSQKVRTRSGKNPARKSSTTKPLHPLKAPRSHPEASRRPERRSHGPSLPGAEVRHSYPKGEGLRDPRTLHPSSQHCIPRVQRFSRAIAQRQSPLRMSKSLKRRPPEQRG